MTGETWTFLTNHAHVLLAIHRDPQLRQRDIARLVGVTEGAVQRILGELEDGGHLRRERQGRRNRYAVIYESPLRHSLDAERTVWDLLAAMDPGSLDRDDGAARDGDGEGPDQDRAGEVPYGDGAVEGSNGEVAHGDGAGEGSNGEVAHGDGAGEGSNGEVAHGDGAGEGSNGGVPHGDGAVEVSNGEVAHGDGDGFVGGADGAGAGVLGRR